MLSTALSLFLVASAGLAPIPDGTPVPHPGAKPPYTAQTKVSNICRTQTGVCLLMPPQPVGSACACGSAPGFVIQAAPSN